MYNGILNVYKEAGYTSFDVVARLRGILKTKKIGHTGTLDPDAVGVLPVCVGNATKLVDLITDKSKEYVAVMRFGVVTDTQDMSGAVIGGEPSLAAKISNDDINRVIGEFTGEIMQVPPMYSALKVNGQKLCDLARKGIEVERKPRPVTIEKIEILEELHEENENYLMKIRVACSKGTYIRTLIHDMGQRLGCGASMESLERTRVGSFGIEEALKIEEIEKLVKEASGENSGKTQGQIQGQTDFEECETENFGLHNVIIPIEEVFSEYPSLIVNEYGEKALRNGNILKPDQVVVKDTSGLHNAKQFGLHNVKQDDLNNEQVYRIYNYVNHFCALYVYESKRGLLVPVKMFLN